MAGQERRSIANRIEVMIRDYCGRNGIAIAEQGTLFDDNQKPPRGGNSTLSVAGTSNAKNGP